MTFKGGKNKAYKGTQPLHFSFLIVSISIFVR